ncbi:hypothetical protein CASFOL_020674 [Castilleja foliolosa]|uniref:Uncharacterized protein n=1 Tax=Castilleja foliolosa TaxID=1961234 RepID=A0ABD3D311_9LAMI
MATITDKKTDDEGAPFHFLSLWKDNLTTRECNMAVIQLFVVVWISRMPNTKKAKCVGISLQILVLLARIIIYLCGAFKGKWLISTYQLFCFLLASTILLFEIQRLAPIV